jgi:hypothetical protein
MGLGSLLLLSGAVFAGSAHRADDSLRAAPSGSQREKASSEPTRSPGIEGFGGGEVEIRGESPEASGEEGALPSAAGDEAEDLPSADPSADEDEAGDDSRGPGSQDGHDGRGGDDEAGHRDHGGGHDDDGAGHGGEDD